MSIGGKILHQIYNKYQMKENQNILTPSELDARLSKKNDKGRFECPLDCG